MNLNDLRKQIDDIDANMLDLFEKRMDIVKHVAEYKKQNNLPIFHKDREQEIIKNIKSKASKQNAQGASVLFSTMMDISRCLQQNVIGTIDLPKTQAIKNAVHHPIKRPDNPNIGCQGVEGGYSYIACKKKFGDAKIKFYDSFEDVFLAVKNDDIHYGVLPIENSNAGSVGEVYKLLSRNNVYIDHSMKLKIDHCLAAKKGAKLQNIKEVYSHYQGLLQCSNFIKNHNLVTNEHYNTAAAAKYVLKSDCQIAAICSTESAELYGLDILEQNIQNNNENYTRFIVISKQIYFDKQDDTIAFSLSLQHSVGSLYALLVKFAIHGLNLTKIESEPIGNKNFDVMFYLCFGGNISNPEVISLINDLENEISDFKFLGNYK